MGKERDRPQKTPTRAVTKRDVQLESLTASILARHEARQREAWLTLGYSLCGILGISATIGFCDPVLGFAIGGMPALLLAVLSTAHVGPKK